MAAAIFSVSAAYNVVPSADARFGTANHRLDVDGSDPRRLDAAISAVTAWFGTVEVIGHRAVPVPGSVETIELRAQDPRGAYGAPMLRLREGRYPAAVGEVAVTDAVAATFQVGVGGTLALGGPPRAVVGLVENPGDLEDEFALTSPSDPGPPESVTILVRASRERATTLPGAVGGRLESRPACHAGLLCLTPGQSEKATAAAGVLIPATVVLLPTITHSAGRIRRWPSSSMPPPCVVPPPDLPDRSIGYRVRARPGGMVGDFAAAGWFWQTLWQSCAMPSGGPARRRAHRPPAVPGASRATRPPCRGARLARRGACRPRRSRPFSPVAGGARAPYPRRRFAAASAGGRPSLVRSIDGFPRRVAGRRDTRPIGRTHVARPHDH